MIDYENFCKIKKLHEQDGLNASQIAGELGLDQRTVKWLTEERYHPRKKYSKASILDPFKAEIGHIIERHPYTATQIFQLRDRYSSDKPQGFGYRVPRN